MNDTVDLIAGTISSMIDHEELHKGKFQVGSLYFCIENISPNHRSLTRAIEDSVIIYYLGRFQNCCNMKQMRVLLIT